MDIYIKFFTQTQNPAIPLRQVVTENGTVYAWSTYNSLIWNIPDGNQWVGSYGTDASTPNFEAVWLFHDMNRAWEWVTTVGGAEPGELLTRWVKNVDSMGVCSGACYVPVVSPNGVFIPHVTVDSPDIVVHEVGHRYHHNALGFWYYANVPSYLFCTQHGMFDIMPNETCSWGEGWADYFALIANSPTDPNDWCFDYTGVGPCGPGASDLGNQGWTDSYAAIGRVGDLVEGRVAGALWDVTDHPDDGFDNRWDSFWYVWTLMREWPHENRPREFYDAWMASWGDTASVACRYYNNTIDYGDCALLYLPLIMRA